MNGKVVVITGASGGIGAALAEALAGRGASLSLMARRKDALDEVAARCGAATLAFAADATVRSDVGRLVAAAVERFGRIDVWVNNVGQGISCPPSALTDDDVDEMIRVNVKSALYGMQEVLPHFQSRATGHIINVSSLLGRRPYVTYRSAYSGSKHFLNAITASFREEVQQTYPEIHVSLVSPGVVRTEFGVNARHGGPDSRLFPQSQSAAEVAEVIVGVIESRRPDVYTLPGMQRSMAAYYATLGEDPVGE